MTPVDDEIPAEPTGKYAIVFAGIKKYVHGGGGSKGTSDGRLWWDMYNGGWYSWDEIILRYHSGAPYDRIFKVVFSGVEEEDWTKMWSIK